MPTHSETRQLPYSAQQMYDLVADVGRYPEFLPWTAAARIRSDEDRGDHRVMDADLVISFKVFRERFTSRVVLWPEAKKIDTEYLDGPFKYMKSNWHFEDNLEGCQVHFFVDFEFRNAMFERLAGQYFDRAFRKMMGAFEARADELYGNKSSSAQTVA